MTRKIIFLFTIQLSISYSLIAQNYPSFGPEKKVIISGLSFDAMEPFISPDGNTLFFNSLNSGGNTNIYYAAKVDDTTFTYMGLVGGIIDTSLNHLDAVASMDSSANFFWISLRNYPGKYENLHRGVYSGGNVSSITRVYGDFNIPSPGWLIMDAAVNYQGDQLLYCNAYFDFINNSCGVGLPCQAKLGMAQKVNDSTFNKILISDAILSNINDTNYLGYAPQLTKDGLELYYTRLLKGTVNTEICVSVRNTLADTFSLPMVIYSNSGFVPEAPTLTNDKQKLYYHQKDSTNSHVIYLRYRTETTSIRKQQGQDDFRVYPNPASSIVTVVLAVPNEDFKLTLYSSIGQELFTSSSKTTLDISDFVKGMYYVMIKQCNRIETIKIIKE